jgi:hypothetical protein
MLRRCSSYRVICSIAALLGFPIYAQIQFSQISNLTPISGVVGTKVTVDGSSFGTTQSASAMTYSRPTTESSSKVSAFSTDRMMLW